MSQQNMKRKSIFVLSVLELLLFCEQKILTVQNSLKKSKLMKSHFMCICYWDCHRKKIYVISCFYASIRLSYRVFLPAQCNKNAARWYNSIIENNYNESFLTAVLYKDGKDKVLRNSKSYTKCDIFCCIMALQNI